MSLYAELSRGPIRAWEPRPMRARTNDIYARLNRMRSNRTNAALSSYNRDSARHRPRASSRDLEFEKRRMKAADKAKIEALEKDIRQEEEKNRIEEEKVRELKKTVLMVDKTNLHVSETIIEHRTDSYFCTEGFLGQLVVRRGQEFRMTFTFQRPWLGKQDDLYLVFNLGENPKEGKATQIKIKLEEGKNTKYMDGQKKAWGARILSQHENSLTVSVYIPPNAVIGQWEYSVITDFVEGSTRKSCRLQGKDDIIILLNPWCKDDQVYMDDQGDLLNEYIWNENGCVFCGDYNSIGKKPWFYGQFQENILEISLHLLRKAFDYEVTPKMSDPVHIGRALSRIMNACDNNGVLIGNWSGKYDGGIKPTTWKGSVPILEQYNEDKEPVKFGQCWVFSHVLTTVARALGLPCRSVTNFSSAHDKDWTLTIDKFVDDEGEIIKWATEDSVWNFHVWNEVWIKRPDLDRLMNAEGKYDGWHTIDATPQEKSDSVYQCGPCPVKAIQCGDVHVGYDTKFVFAEVNGEVCHWRRSGDQLSLVGRDSSSVGKFISTKKPTGEPMNSSFFARDCDNRTDITHLYKHPEGSVAEREAVARAVEGTQHGDLVFANPTGIEISFLPIPDRKFGDDVTTTVKVLNTSSTTRSVRVKLTVRPQTYWGEVIGTKLIISDTFTETKIEPNAFKTFDLLIESNKYLEGCDEQLFMSVLAMAVVRDFGDHINRVYGSEDFRVKTGAIDVEGPTDSVNAGQPVELLLKFSNTTKKNLTNCVIEIEGGVEVMDADFIKKHSVFRKKINDIKPNEDVAIKVTVAPNLIPKKSFRREVEVGMVCSGVPDFDGAFQIYLKD